MKFPIAWHEERLKNATATYAKNAEALERQRISLEHTRVELAIYEYQIAEAKKRGKDGFDREKFNRPRSAVK